MFSSLKLYGHLGDIPFEVTIGGSVNIGDPIGGGAATDFLFVDKNVKLGQLAVTVGTLTAGAYTVPTGTLFVVIDTGGGSVSSATITLPSSPYDKQVVFVGFDGGVAALAFNAPGGATVGGVPPSIGFANGGGLIQCIYHAADTQWKCSAGSSPSLGIGAPVGSGTPGQILYVDSNGNLFSSAKLFLDQTTGEFFASDNSGNNAIDNIPGNVLLLGNDTSFAFVLPSGFVLDYNQTNANAWTFSRKAITVASTTALAGFNLPAGVAPTSPADGDIWYDGTHMYGQIAGVTKQLDN